MALMALNELLQIQLEEKVAGEWLTIEEVRKIWSKRAMVREAVRKLYKAKGESLSLDDELTFLDEVFTCCLTKESSPLQEPTIQQWLNAN